MLPAVLQLVGEDAVAEGGVACMVLDGLHIAHAVEAVTEELGGQGGSGSGRGTDTEMHLLQSPFINQSVAISDSLLVLP